MTSGNFISVAIGDIIVNRAERQRRELPNLDVLADSIKRLGLIHPIVIDRTTSVLVAGERRLEAVRSLGWSHIVCQYADELDDSTARAIELEENVKREALPWLDECKAVLEYHELRAAEEAEWHPEDTGLALGLGAVSVQQKIKVAREALAGNEMVLNAERFSTARGIVQRAESRKDDEALAAIGPRPKVSGDTTEAIQDSILCADFNEWAGTYTGPRFNFIHCDFPYGINANKFNQGSASLHGGYSDTEDDYWRLVTTLVANEDRLFGESAHIMFWFSMDYYTETLAFFEKHSSFRLATKPLIWTKSDNVGILPDPERGPRQIYETCLFGSRGDRKIVRPTSNSISSPSQRDEHMSIKPETMLGSFFRMFVDSNTIMLDPTCGSGGALRAAEALAASHVVGLERDPDFAARANIALNKARSLRRANAQASTSPHAPVGAGTGDLSPKGGDVDREYMSGVSS